MPIPTTPPETATLTLARAMNARLQERRDHAEIIIDLQKM
jgi:hypothetical protein